MCKIKFNATEVAPSRGSACDLPAAILAAGGNGIRVPPKPLKKIGLVPGRILGSASMEGDNGSGFQEELRA